MRSSELRFDDCLVTGSTRTDLNMTGTGNLYTGTFLNTINNNLKMDSTWLGLNSKPAEGGKNEKESWLEWSVPDEVLECFWRLHLFPNFIIKRA